MTNNISEEELLLRKRARRRLLGAIVLVIAAVIILPMIFDQPKQIRQQAIDIKTPIEDVEINVAPLSNDEELPIADVYEAVEDSIDPMASIQQLPDDSLDFSQDDMLITQELSVQRIPIPGFKPNKPEVIKEEIAIFVDQSEAVPGTGEFVVQLGAFSNQVMAKQQQQNLVVNGINAYTETRSIDNNEITRVRIGPFLSRKAAEVQLDQLKKLGLNGVVTVR